MIAQLTIKNFQSFEQFDWAEPGSLNVIIGENSTGKTGLLKLMYATAKSLENYFKRLEPGGQKEPFNDILAAKLLDTFQPRSASRLGELVRKHSEAPLVMEATFTGESRMNLRYSFHTSTTQKISDCTSQIHPFAPAFNTLFIPAKEILTAIRAIAATRRQLQLYGFDDTYLDLADALFVPTVQGKIAKELMAVKDRINKFFDGEIRQDDQLDFLFKHSQQYQFTMPLTAEGIKKQGILNTLITNRLLKKGTILFMDEPDTSLHPRAVVELAECLALLAQGGVQIFITTHNYFLIKQLSIIARRDNKPMPCLSLYNEKTKRSGLPVTQVKAQDMRQGLPDNAIIQVSIAMLAEELKLDTQP